MDTTRKQGLEGSGNLLLGCDFSIGGNYTWLPAARLESTRIIGGVDRKGNRLPYAHEHFLHANLRRAVGPMRDGQSASYQLTVKSRFYGTVKSLIDETYIAFRAPEGIPSRHRVHGTGGLAGGFLGPGFA